jgi:hypothetical protein
MGYLLGMIIMLGSGYVVFKSGKLIDSRQGYFVG